jgi:hypothetical protein
MTRRMRRCGRSRAYPETVQLKYNPWLQGVGLIVRWVVAGLVQGFLGSFLHQDHCQ